MADMEAGAMLGLRLPICESILLDWYYYRLCGRLALCSRSHLHLRRLSFVAVRLKHQMIIAPTSALADSSSVSPKAVS